MRTERAAVAVAAVVVAVAVAVLGRRTTTKRRTTAGSTGTDCCTMYFYVYAHMSSPFGLVNDLGSFRPGRIPIAVAGLGCFVLSYSGPPPHKRKPVPDEPVPDVLVNYA